MLYYDRIYLRKESDVVKSKISKGCIISLYWFFNHGLKLDHSISNGYHDLTMLCLNNSDIAIIAVKDIDYYCIIHDLRKSEAIHWSENLVLDNRRYI